MTDAIIQIDPTEAAERISGGGELLLDVRSPEEFAAGHAPTAHLLELNQLASRLDELDRTTPIIAICRSGIRSQTAAELLAASGFSVVNLAGGTIAWQAAGFELVDAGGAPDIVE